MPQSSQLLIDICETSYFPQKLSIRADDTRRQYRYALTDFGRWLSHQPRVDDLTDANLAGYMRSLVARNLSEYTANERAGRVKSLWNWLAKKGKVRTFPTIGKLQAPIRVPRAWNQAQLQHLFAAAAKMPGKVGTIRACDWWPALHAVLWNTGERIGAVLQLRWEWIDLESGDVIVPAEARKARTRDMAYRLWPDTLAMLLSIRQPACPLVLPWPFSEGQFYRCYRQLVKLANLPDDRKSKAHRMRVSHATWAKIAGNNPTERMGHASAETTKRSYLDPTLCRENDKPLFVPWAG